MSKLSYLFVLLNAKLFIPSEWTSRWICVLRADCVLTVWFIWQLVCVFVRESEDTVLMILKEIYAVMGITAHKSRTDAIPVQQSAPLYNQAPGLPPPGSSLPPPLSQPPLFNPAVAVPQMNNGSSGVPVFAMPPHMSNSAIGGPPLPTTPLNTYPDSSSYPAASQSSAVGPPPKSGFVRK